MSAEVIAGGVEDEEEEERNQNVDGREDCQYCPVIWYKPIQSKFLI